MNTFQEISTHLQKTSSKQIKKWFYFLLIPYLILLISFAIALATSQIRVFFIAGLLVSAFSIGYLFLFLLKKKVDQISKSQIQASFFVEYANIYYQVLNKGLQLLRDSDFTQPTESLKEEESKIQEYEDLLNRLKEASEKIKWIHINNQRISFDLVGSILALVEASNTQASGSSEQASAIGEITATMEELARTAAQVADNSNRVAKLAENSDTASKDGFALINNVIQSIETIDEKMHQISQKTHVLGSQSKQIGKVLDIIYNIADETHLLALNASIESVAAGEFGKRFGVVAAEVRRLAEISKENAESIKSIIEEFQNSINTTVLSIEEGSKMISNVNQTAQEIIQHLKNITEAVAQTSENSNEISIATQQQKSSSDQIVLTLKDISEVTKQQAQELKKSSKELEKLNSLALNLQLLTQKTIIDSPLNLGFKIKKMVKTPDIYSMDRQRHQQAYERFAEVNPVIEFMYIADSKGILFSYSLGKKDGEIPDILKIGNDDSKRPWFVNAANSKLPYISKVYKSFFSNEDCFSVAIGIFDKKDQFVGVMAIDINVNEWNKIRQ